MVRYPQLLAGGRCFFLAVITLTCLFYHYTYDVRLGSAGVELIVFKRFVVFSIPYGELGRVERGSIGNRMFSFAFSLVNRPCGKAFVLYRNRGFLLRRILVTPGDPDAFWNGLTQPRPQSMDKPQS